MVVVVEEVEFWNYRKSGILPCPFCGGESGVIERTLRGGFENIRDDPDAWAYSVRCGSCAAEGGWSKGKSGALRCWNMRHEGVAQ